MTLAQPHIEALRQSEPKGESDREKTHSVTVTVEEHATPVLSEASCLGLWGSWLPERQVGPGPPAALSLTLRPGPASI